jgi:hypothetical protein
MSARSGDTLGRTPRNPNPSDQLPRVGVILLALVLGQRHAGVSGVIRKAKNGTER